MSTIDQIIADAVEELNLQLPQNNHLKNAPDTKLVDESGILDSLALVTLLVSIEERVTNQMKARVSLLDVLTADYEPAVHPFKDLRGLKAWIVENTGSS